jgi:hypothetical protein
MSGVRGGPISLDKLRDNCLDFLAATSRESPYGRLGISLAKCPATHRRRTLTQDELAHEHLKLLETVWAAAGGKVSPPDMVVPAVINRSLSILNAMAVALSTENAIVSAPLLRMQIDSILRFYAFFLVEDQVALLNALYEDQPFSRMTDKLGNRLSGA